MFSTLLLAVSPGAFAGIVVLGSHEGTEDTLTARACVLVKVCPPNVTDVHAGETTGIFLPGNKFVMRGKNAFLCFPSLFPSFRAVSSGVLSLLVFDHKMR